MSSKEKSKSIETGSKLLVVRAFREEKWAVIANGHGASFGADENIRN